MEDASSWIINGYPGLAFRTGIDTLIYDTFVIKSLFFAEDAETFLSASEPTSLLEIRGGAIA